MAIVIAIVFFMVLGAFMLKIYFDENISGFKGILFLALNVLLFFLALYTPWVYFKNTYTICFDDKRLKFKSAFDSFELTWDEIERIRITGKVYFRYIIPYPMEGTVIKTKNREIILYDTLFVKPHLIKYALHTYYKTKKFPDDFNDIPVKNSETRFEKFNLFKGSPVFSFRGILIWGLIMFFLILPIINPPKSINTWIGLMTFGVLWLLANSIFMNYFGVSDKYLVIRNHFNPLKNRVYRLDDIKEVVYETRDKWPNCMRVITKKYHSKLYPAGTLRDKTWLKMKKDFESNKIKVRNECI